MPDNAGQIRDEKSLLHLRSYGSLVNNEIIEDYSLRYSPPRFRKWSEFVVFNTAIGSISFLALEAIGASIALNYGFQNAFWGILVASVIIFILGAPICYHAAKNNIDIDLLTRAAGFGYLGSTVTSLIYASFCFIFFALEAAIMAQAIYLYTGLPLAAGYILCSVIILPVVFYGMTAISRLQVITQPFWLVLMIAPFVVVAIKDPNVWNHFIHLPGNVSSSDQFSWQFFGVSLGISLSLIAQIGEQADYLRFMPDKSRSNRLKWWFSVIFAGPGWAILGFLKQIGGIFLAALVLLGGASIVEAREPIHMFNAAYKYVFENPEVALIVSFIFVMISQIKINVTNAYAGSLAWSNFFSRTTHTHLGRAVWVVFNIAIALMLMLMGVFDVLEKILGLYSNVAIAWVAAIFADLMINKPLGLSPPTIEFKRAYLFNVNPVGCVSTLAASVLAMVAFSGALGSELQAFSSVVALVTALVLSPTICHLTKGRYYIARPAEPFEPGQHQCSVCNGKFSAEDMVSCPMHAAEICSLCCSVEGRCHDICKPEGEFNIIEKVINWAGDLSNGRIHLEKLSRVVRFFVVFLGLLMTATFILWTSYIVQIEGVNPTEVNTVSSTYLNIYALIAMLLFIGSWIIVLMHESRSYSEIERQEAEEQLKEQTARASLLQETATFANEANNFHQALEGCIAIIAKHTGWSLGHAYELSRTDNDLLVPLQIWHIKDAEQFRAFVETTEKTTFRSGIGLPGRALEHRDSVWIIDVTKDPNFPRADLARQCGLHSAFAFPVFSEGQVIAVIEFFSEDVDKPDDSLLFTVSHIGAQLGQVYEREAAELELLSARDKAEAATRSKAAFLAAMSHEIRTPMNGVIGMISLLQEGELKPDQRTMMNTVQDSAFSLLQIINDILDFSKIEAGKLSLESIPVSIDSVMEGVAETLLPNAAKKDLRLSLFIDPDIPGHVLTDQVRLRQILFNLAGNAIKFTENTRKRQGKVSLRAELGEPGKKGQVRVRFSVTDNGIGMNAEAVGRLFKPFSQADETTTRRFGGTGLGLSICKNLTDIMGGKIGVESAEGEGSTFHFSLPFEVTDQAESRLRTFDFSGLSVVYVGLDDDIGEAVERYALSGGSNFARIAGENVTDGVKAQADKSPMDIVILGALENGQDRESVIEDLRASAALPELRFIVLTDDRTDQLGMVLPDKFLVDSAPLRKSAFMQGVAIAVGRASPEVEGEAPKLSSSSRKAPSIEEARVAGELILVAEDNLTNQDVIRRQLDILGYACEVADDGAIALDMLTDGDYGMLLTDCHMPNMDGYELTAALRDLEQNVTKRLPVIAITANALQGEADHCLAAGMDDYMSKPLDMNKLKAMLAKWLPVDHGKANGEASENVTIPAKTEGPAADNEAPVEPTFLRETFGDDDDLINGILKDFIDPALGVMEETENGFANRNSNEVRNAAHKLKSSSRSIGADKLSDLCAKLESAGKDNDWEKIEELFLELRPAFDAVIEYIRKI